MAKMATVKMVFHRNCLNVILLRSKKKNHGTAAVLKEILGVTVEVVADGIVDSRVMVRLGLDFDHSRNLGFAVPLVKFTENGQKLEERLPELEN